MFEEFGTTLRTVNAYPAMLILALADQVERYLLSRGREHEVVRIRGSAWKSSTLVGRPQYFVALKSRGLKAVYMTAPSRLGRLFGLPCIVLGWTVRVGKALLVDHLPLRNRRGQQAQSRVQVGWLALSASVCWRSNTFWRYLALPMTPFPLPSEEEA